MPGYNPDRRDELARGLKAARKRLGLTAEAASEEISRLGLQCKRGTLLSWERGCGPTSREPYASDLGIIAGVYRCSVGDLFAPSELAPARMPLSVV